MSHMPSNAEIFEISMLTARQVACEKEVADLEASLKEAKEKLRRVQEEDLPAAMAQAGVKSITLPSGESVLIKEDIAASIPKDERYHDAIDWLKEHGFGDVIKNEFKVNFGKGEEDRAQQFAQWLGRNGLGNAYSSSISVHPGTLKALIKEQLGLGTVDVPMELFGVFTITKAQVKK